MKKDRIQQMLARQDRGHDNLGSSGCAGAVLELEAERGSLRDATRPGLVGTAPPEQRLKVQRRGSMIPQRRSSRTPRERIVTNCLLYQNVGELQHVIKQSAKERLLLERQVAQLHQTVRAQKERSEQELRVRLHDVEERLREQESQLAQLQKDLDDRCEISADLRRQRAPTASYNFSVCFKGVNEDPIETR
ncbi:peripheral-type benzodiazepine receptor-associated protein 1-like [Ixodes scapularis]